MNPPYQHPCQLAISEALQVVSGKWSYFVISQLCQGAQRFNQLQRSLGGVSVKSLTDTLRQLEQYEIVSRHVFPTVPVTVEYALTEKGKEYGAILLEMRKWGEKWSRQPTV
ncbi:winged helix-turn-helix transcriptional regulator [Paenibacillus allorhizosphaerae]|uniref:HTH-type transcriptional regulator YybR n=1 Tax=Paenibacillus allorhizosphaerae TaxID=2849866 RepID=A0ABN7TUV3_9BACL|nr:helix-turn-helix domain-containing protein [Paenibacillus allorhizosphaerae]CAG7653016.1 putative HTH-type transcriptional regulator YybR [Paenibacillus allorhizosphaerae]